MPSSKAGSEGPADPPTAREPASQPPADPRARRLKRAAWLLAVVVLCSWPGRLDLLDPDEGRHAEIAREMLAGGSFVVPRLQGQPYYHKPVGFHWLAAASVAVFGRNSAAPRLPSIAAAFVVLAMTGWWTANAYSARAAPLAVAGLATTPFFVVIGRLATVDMLFTAALTAALAWLGVWFVRPPDRRPSIFPFYLLVGLGTLVKGPAAIAICAMVAMAIVVRSRSWATIEALAPVRGGLLVLAVATPWYLAAYRVDPEYITTFLLRHNLARYAGGGHIGHQQGWLYYPAVLPLALLPWTPMIAAAVVRRLRGGTRTDADLYAAWWAGAVFLFFLPASTRLVTYMLPAFPPLFSLAARVAADPGWRLRAGDSRALQRTAGGWCLFVALLGVALAGLAAWMSPASLLNGWTVLAALVVAAWWWRNRAVASGGALLAIVAASSLTAVLMTYSVGADLLDSAKSTKEAAAIVARELPADADLASFRCFQHALAFYAGRTVRKATTPAEAVAGLRGRGAAALLTKPKYLEALGLTPLPEGVEQRWRGGPGCILLWKNGYR